MLNEYDPHIKEILPHGKMFTLQIGNKRFLLSGASLSSDAPSYFTNYFLIPGNAEKVLFIDRSPAVFKMVYAHLQGYFLEIASADDFTQLFNDALYYNLPRLLEVLQNSDYYYAIVGGESIKFPKKLLSDKANIPNYFSVSNQTLFADLSQLLVTKRWIRPPPQSAPVVNRCPLLLKDLIHLLQGVEVDIRSEEHRKSLIKEAKYYRFNTLVQQLVKHKITYNPFLQKEEITIGLEYIDFRNVKLDTSDEWTIKQECDDLDHQFGIDIKSAKLGYQRPTIDAYPRPLLIQFDQPEVKIIPSATEVGELVIEFEHQTNVRMTKILKAFDPRGNSTPSPNGTPSYPLQNIILPVNKRNDFSIILNSDCPLESSQITQPIVLLKCILSFELIDHVESKRWEVNLLKGDGVNCLKKFYNRVDSYV